jgi:hypothetical protein
MKLPAPAYWQEGLPSPKRLPSTRLLEAGLRAGRHRASLPGNVEIIIGSALTPLRESVSALPTDRAGHPADLPVKPGP